MDNPSCQALLVADRAHALRRTRALVALHPAAMAAAAAAARSEGAPRPRPQPQPQNAAETSAAGAKRRLTARKRAAPAEAPAEAPRLKKAEKLYVET
jgi:hypothetical protein